MCSTGMASKKVKVMQACGFTITNSADPIHLTPALKNCTFNVSEKQSANVFKGFLRETCIPYALCRLQTVHERIKRRLDFLRLAVVSST